MTIGKKITHLRNSIGISQEELAAKLGISRQSISKWERDQVVPKTEALKELSNLFNISTDDLISDDVVINRIKPEEKKIVLEGKTKYFGTDGFRGKVGTVLTSDHAYKIGRFLGWYFQNSISGCKKYSYRPRIVIGKDTRKSSYTLEWAVAAGITASGADAYILHVTTTPSVAYITRKDDFDCGIMITASHNPFYDNGIKILSNKGEKLDDSTALLIEAYLDGELNKIGVSEKDLPLASEEKIGCVIDYVSGRNRYIGYLISLAQNSYRDLKIGLDCANGSSWMIAKSVFDALGAQTYVTGNTPNGVNVNEGVGSTHIENLQKFVCEKSLDIGFAFDGDADRCIAVDNAGNIVDGDKIIYALAKSFKARGSLNGNTVVTTIMSNSGLDKALSEIGVKNVRTDVGDRFVYERMQNEDFMIGGEQSGHIIIKKYATTGDGILTAIMLTEEVIESKQSLAELTAPVKLYPQVTKSVRVTSKEASMSDPDVLKKYDECMAEINGEGRVLLRKSGTEPVVRVMCEAANKELCNKYIEEIINVLRKKGYVC